MVGFHFFQGFWEFGVGFVIVDMFVSEFFCVWVFSLVSRYFLEPAAT